MVRLDGDRPGSPRRDVETGHDVPVEFGPGQVGETIGRVRKSFEKGQGVAGLTADQLRRREALREHNRHDCVGMRKVCLIAAEEIAATGSYGRHAIGPQASCQSSIW